MFRTTRKNWDTLTADFIRYADLPDTDERMSDDEYEQTQVDISHRFMDAVPYPSGAATGATPYFTQHGDTGGFAFVAPAGDSVHFYLAQWLADLEGNARTRESFVDDVAVLLDRVAGNSRVVADSKVRIAVSVDYQDYMTVEVAVSDLDVAQVATISRVGRLGEVLATRKVSDATDLAELIADGYDAYFGQGVVMFA